MIDQCLFAPAVWNDGRLGGPHRLIVADGAWDSVEPATGPSPGDVSVDGLVATGLIDLHAHFGVGPYALAAGDVASHGVVAICSQGDAGPDNYDEWVQAAEAIAVPTYLALNLAPQGEALHGCFDRIDAGSVRRAIDVAHNHADRIPLLAVNLSERSLGRARCAHVLSIAIEVAEAIRRPLLLALAPDHVMPIADQLAVLRPGDIVTYCFREHPWCLFPASGPHPDLVAAIGRGVLLDVAHGSEAFSAEVAHRAIGWGFAPDIVSSGRKVAESGSPDPPALVEVIVRLLRVGLPLEDALRASTTAPARLLGLETPSAALGAPAGFAIVPDEPHHVG